MGRCNPCPEYAGGPKTLCRKLQAPVLGGGRFFKDTSRAPVRLPLPASPSLAASLLSLWLSENSAPKASGSYTVRRVYTPDGREVPFDEIEPGGLVQVRGFRAIEAEGGGQDYRDQTTTFMLVGVRVDYEQGSAELIPDDEGDIFKRQMAVIAMLMGG